MEGPPLFQSEEKQIDPYGHKESIDSYKPKNMNFLWVVKKCMGFAKNLHTCIVIKIPSYNDAYRPPLPIVPVKLEIGLQRGPKQRSL